MIDRCVVMYSGGLISYGAAKRAVDRFGAANVRLLFADTNMEDEDLYRFLDETSAHLGAELVRIADGRTPWQVFRDEKFIGNSRVDPCSKILKRQLMDRWVENNCDKATTVLAYGLDWSERTRIEGTKKKKGHRLRIAERGWMAWYPMDEKPYLVKKEIIEDLHSVGIQEPRLYKLGYPHNNCGGYCCKMGLSQALHLLRTQPLRYEFHEDQEQRLLNEIPTTKPSLRFRRRGVTRRVSLREFREIAESQCDLLRGIEDQGWGCGGSCGIE